MLIDIEGNQALNGAEAVEVVQIEPIILDLPPKYLNQRIRPAHLYPSEDTPDTGFLECRVDGVVDVLDAGIGHQLRAASANLPQLGDRGLGVHPLLWSYPIFVAIVPPSGGLWCKQCPNSASVRCHRPNREVLQVVRLDEVPHGLFFGEGQARGLLLRARASIVEDAQGGSLFPTPPSRHIQTDRGQGQPTGHGLHGSIDDGQNSSLVVPLGQPVVRQSSSAHSNQHQQQTQERPQSPYQPLQLRQLGSEFGVAALEAFRRNHSELSALLPSGSSRAGQRHVIDDFWPSNGDKVAESLAYSRQTASPWCASVRE